MSNAERRSKNVEVEFRIKTWILPTAGKLGEILTSIRFQNLISTLFLGAARRGGYFYGISVESDLASNF